MLGKRARLKREDGARGLKSMRDVYKEQGCKWHAKFGMSKNRWIQAAWRRETLKVENTVAMEARTTMEEVGMRLKFKDNAMQW